MGGKAPAGEWSDTSDSTAALVSEDRLRPLSSYAMAVGPMEELMPYLVTIARASLVACMAFVTLECVRLGIGMTFS